MADELKLEHKSLDEAINYHSVWFEYNINMGHLAIRGVSHQSPHPMMTTSAEKLFAEAAIHANILRELRYQQAVRIQAEAFAKMDKPTTIDDLYRGSKS